MRVAGFSLATARRLQPTQMWMGKLTLWLVEESIPGPDCWERWIAEAKRLGTETLPALSERFGLPEALLQTIQDRPARPSRVQRFFVQLPSSQDLHTVDAAIELPPDSLLPHSDAPPFPNDAKDLPLEGTALRLATPYQVEVLVSKNNESFYVHLKGQDTPFVLVGSATFPESSPGDWQQAWRDWCQANGQVEHAEATLEKLGIELSFPEEVKTKLSEEIWLAVGEGDWIEVAVVVG
jgi:hypothetical protein